MIAVQVDDREFHKAVATLGRMTRTLPVRRMAVVAHRSVLRNFSESGRPTKWKALKRATVDRRRKGKSGRSGVSKRGGAYRDRAGRFAAHGGLARPLLDTATLRNSISFKVFGGHNFKVYTQLIYAGVHQFGSKPGRKPKIPARPYMVWQTEDKRLMVEIALDHIRKGL